MKVRDLLAILQKHGQEAEIQVYNNDTDEGYSSMQLVDVTCDNFDGNQIVYLNVEEI